MLVIEPGLADNFLEQSCKWFRNQNQNQSLVCWTQDRNHNVMMLELESESSFLRSFEIRIRQNHLLLESESEQWIWWAQELESESLATGIKIRIIKNCKPGISSPICTKILLKKEVISNYIDFSISVHVTLKHNKIQCIKVS